jgi:putative metalloprotease
MNRLPALAVAFALAAPLVPGPVHAQFDLGRALGAAVDLGKAASVSDEEVKNYARQMRAYEERNKQKVAPPGSKYAQRLASLTDRYRRYDGLDLNFKVYQSATVNANASADGSVRVYSGLMDLMTDDELLFVIGHEIGHVKHGHSAKAMRTALTTSGLRKAAGAATSSTVATLADSQLGGLLEGVVNAQHSQAQETESDDYGMKFLRANKHDTRAAASSLRKLAKLGGGGSSILSSHPDPGKRADRLSGG